MCAPKTSGFPVNPGKRMLFLEKDGRRERGKDHDPVSTGRMATVRALAAAASRAQMPVANRAMMTMMVICMTPCAATATKKLCIMRAIRA